MQKTGHVHFPHGEGTIPIERTIVVEDGWGNRCESTYPRRAKQLVKKGRARFVGPDRIRLACPPVETLEDIAMSDMQITAQDILARIDRILDDTAYLKDAFTTIEKIPQGDNATETARLKAEAVERMVQSREKTHRQALRLLESLAGEREEDAGGDKKGGGEKETEEKNPRGPPRKRGAFLFHAFPLQIPGEMMKFRINSLVRKPPKCYNIDKITRRNFFAFLKDCRVKQAAGEHPRRK